MLDTPSVPTACSSMSGVVPISTLPTTTTPPNPIEIVELLAPTPINHSNQHHTNTYHHHDGTRACERASPLRGPLVCAHVGDDPLSDDDDPSSSQVNNRNAFVCSI